MGANIFDRNLWAKIPFCLVPLTPVAVNSMAGTNNGVTTHISNSTHYEGNHFPDRKS